MGSGWLARSGKRVWQSDTLKSSGLKLQAVFSCGPRVLCGYPRTCGGSNITNISTSRLLGTVVTILLEIACWAKPCHIQIVVGSMAQYPSFSNMILPTTIPILVLLGRYTPQNKINIIHPYTSHIVRTIPTLSTIDTSITTESCATDPQQMDCLFKYGTPIPVGQLYPQTLWICLLVKFPLLRQTHEYIRLYTHSYVYINIYIIKCIIPTIYTMYYLLSTVDWSKWSATKIRLFVIHLVVSH